MREAMVTRRKRFARAIRSSAPDAAMLGIRALATSFVGSMALEEGHKLRRRELRQDFRGPGDGLAGA